jgi:hypothetical protein
LAQSLQRELGFELIRGSMAHGSLTTGMERTHSTPSSPRRSATGVAAALALLVAGCGEKEAYKNEPRPPAPINVAAYISPDRVSVSPSNFGAGPIVLIVTNQSRDSQEAIIETEGSGANSGLNQSTGPINPGDTGQIKLDVKQGTYQLRVRSATIDPATMRVGSERESAQNKVLQP